MRFVEHPAAALVAPDGHRVRLVDASKPTQVATLEWARDETVGLLQSGPEVFGVWFGLGPDSKLEVAYSRATMTILGGPTVVRVERLLSVEAEGVRTNAIRDTRAPGSLYLPGKLTLVADIAAGSSWTSTGEFRRLANTTVSAPTSYTTKSHAERASNPALAKEGCLDVVEEEEIQGSAPARSVMTWCPGSGIQAITEADQVLTAAQAPVAVADSAATGFDWTAPERLRFTTFPVSHVGTSLVYQSPAAAPGVLPDGTLLYANRSGGDLVAVRPGETVEPTLWRARPGGSIVTAATVATTTVVVTSERQAVAYGPEGEWLWTAPLSDVARLPPQAFAGGVLVTTVEGTVRLLELASGSERWSHAMPAEIRVAPVISAGAIVVADQSGTFVQLDAAGQEVWQTKEAKPETMALVGGTLVAAPHAGSTISAYGWADGELTWQIRPDSPFEQIISMGDVVVVRTVDTIRGYDPATGSLRWLHRLVAEQLAGEGNRVIAITAGDLVVLDANIGSELSRVPLELGDLSKNSFWVAAGSGRFVVTTTSKAAIGVMS